eukprot:CAMPEP_0115360356 /NCGR_PEP_ID=MMETSP0270-20121206/101644_1 /TAXON_ID=71861 /ORGANISM="Scrippsiella trochoidea, Strain CCMP3099" /LENGTH=134 /DNA_ID=CAMNT_0002782887 /DNA_START=196 /DNA_END=599 /DNA_ORIENTATION=-
MPKKRAVLEPKTRYSTSLPTVILVAVATRTSKIILWGSKPPTARVIGTLQAEEADQNGGEGEKHVHDREQYHLQPCGLVTLSSLSPDCKESVPPQHRLQRRQGASIYPVPSRDPCVLRATVLPPAYEPEDGEHR